MANRYEEMVEVSAIKIAANVSSEIIETLYIGIIEGKIKFDEPGLRKAINEILGDYMSLEGLGLKFEGIYQALQRRFEMIEN